MPGLVPGIRRVLNGSYMQEDWMAGTSPAMTNMTAE